jgi:DnaJ-class molecular chaperone
MAHERKKVPFGPTRPLKCSTCNGSGTVRVGRDEKTCPNCGGTGEV